MKRIGIIGGLGPEATVEYYKQIIDAFKSENSDLSYPEIIIYSVTMSEFIGLMKEKKYDAAAALLSNKIERLAHAGADFAVLSANTPHQMFDQIKEQSSIPLISIVEATCEEAGRRGLKRPGLLGTGFTMKASFYPDVFTKHGIEILTPDQEDQELINYKLFTEIELGIFKEETRQMLIGVIQKMISTRQIDSIILGCTEFPLILDQETYAGIPVLDTTKIHVEAIVRYCRG